jgi:hypothetical protein
MRKPKKACQRIGGNDRDGLAEEGFDVQVHSNPRSGREGAIIPADANEGAQSRADAIAAELRQWCDLDA